MKTCIVYFVLSIVGIILANDCCLKKVKYRVFFKTVSFLCKCQFWRSTERFSIFLVDFYLSLNKIQKDTFSKTLCTMRGGRPAITTSHPSHILLIFSCEPPRNLGYYVLKSFLNINLFLTNLATLVNMDRLLQWHSFISISWHKNIR